MNNFRKKYNKEAVKEMMHKFGYKNQMAVPNVTKVVVSTGTGSVSDSGKKELIIKALTAITGQKPKNNVAKKSIATFKLREGMPIGYSITLRGKRMYDFLDKLINVTIPRVRDFRGLNLNSIDTTGGLTIGFKEHVVFPETSRDDVRSSFGLGVTVSTSAKNKEEALGLFKLYGFPFKKEN